MMTSHRSTTFDAILSIFKGKVADINGDTMKMAKSLQTEQSQNSITVPEACLTPSPTTEKLICLFDESPFYILKVAAQGNVSEVQRLVQQDRSRLFIRDYRGQNIAHHAATWSRISVLDFLTTLGIPLNNIINAQDKVGNTPMHHAIERNQIQAVSWLLNHGANIKLKNIRQQTPIHFAVDHLKPEIVQFILKKYPWAVDLSCDLGPTPLHYACMKDSPEIATILLEAGADLLKCSQNGCPPIHAATRHGSAKVIKVLLDFAAKRGMADKALIHMPDKQHSLPLHAATNSGDLKAIKICLEAGADIDVQQPNDRQTAIHYAASQGDTEMIRMMFDAQPEKRENCVHCRDILEQTPLHKAAMFNHVKVVEQLIEEGASINAQDGEKLTPLLLAAAKHASAVVNYLLKRRANTTLKDKDSRNFLHLIILHGSKIKDIDFGQIRNLENLMNERDDFGCAPIHYAAKSGQLSTLRLLLTHGATVTILDNSKWNALHYAAMFGRYQTCRTLLASQNGALLINETDGDGKTPLHLAASRGNNKIVALLVRNGALMTKDFQHNTPLHLAAENGHFDTVIILVSLAPYLLNNQNKSKNTALHLSAMNGHALVVDSLMTADATFEVNSDGATFFDVTIAKFQSDVAAAIINHRRCQEAMELPSNFGTPFVGLIQHLPKIALLYLDKCLTYSADDKKSPNFCIRYDFRYLQILNSKEKAIKLSRDLPSYLPMNMMIKYNRVECLAHPVCVTYLKQKWSSFGSMIYNLRVGVYVLFLTLLTWVCLDLDNSVVIHDSPTAEDDTHSLRLSSARNRANQSLVIATYSSYLTMKPIESSLFLRMLIVAVFCFGNLLVQLVTILQQRLAYFLKLTHYLEWILYIAAFIASSPPVFTDVVSIRDQLACAAISILFGWILLLLYMQRFEFFGMYVVMFLQVAKTLMRALVVFSFIIIAFGLSFNLVFRTARQETQEFKNPLVSLMSTLSMMVGEENYVHIITPTLDGRRELIYGALTYVFFIAFILLLPTLLMNLLVGLAVGDIESVQKNAELKRLAMQVEYFMMLEQKLPNVFVRRHILTDYKFYPNRSRFEIIEAFQSFFRARDAIEDSSTEADLLNDKSSDFTFLLEELTLQSKQIGALTAKLETHQDLLKSLVKKIDNEFHLDDDPNEDEAENTFDDDNNSSKDKSYAMHCHEFHSAGSRAQWHVVATRLSSIKKPRTSHIWSSSEDEVVSRTSLSRVHSVLDVPH